MKITVTGSFEYVCCDHDSDQPNGYLVTPLRKIDIHEFVQSDFAEPENVGNTMLQLTFGISRTHEDFTAAELYVSLLDFSVPKSGTLRIWLNDRHSFLEATGTAVEVNHLPPIGILTTVNYIMKFPRWSKVVSYAKAKDADGKQLFTADGQLIRVKEDII